MMFSLFIQVGILSSGIFTDLSYLVVSEPAVYVDGSKGLKRDPRLAIAYANFRAHNFSRLDLIPLVSTTVKEIRECAKLCVDHLSCFSFNCAAFRNNVERKILCQLLQSDKYRESNMFASSPVFHHFSIKTPCSSGPCANNATCVAKYESDDYQCACAPGYSGMHCEIDIDECYSDPCLNDGLCSDQVNRFSCSCLPGYTGSQCETDINECYSDPCLNGGLCSDQVNRYSCSCLPGYIGSHCETDINECSSNPCLNGGMCVDGVNKFHCNCPAYIKGITCQTIDVQDPVALYPFNAAYTTRDMMESQPDGTASNVQLAVGPHGDAGGSYQFWGTSNSYIELPNNGGLDTQYSLSLVMWVLPEGPSGPLFNYRPSGAWAVHFWIANGNLFFRLANRNDVMVSALTSPVNFGQWIYVGASYDYSTGIARLWIDGTQVKQSTLGIFTLSTFTNVRLGVKSDDSRYFKGRIARVQVYNIALNREQYLAVKSRG